MEERVISKWFPQTNQAIRISTLIIKCDISKLIYYTSTSVAAQCKNPYYPRLCSEHTSSIFSPHNSEWHGNCHIHPFLPQKEVKGGEVLTKIKLGVWICWGNSGQFQSEKGLGCVQNWFATPVVYKCSVETGDWDMFRQEAWNEESKHKSSRVSDG
jgi:hypothetical protein